MRNPGTSDSHTFLPVTGVWTGSFVLTFGAE